ncbi:hypothetical protein A374_03719 [Fictibacillus macauensis ZFHKF-1]|uniref:Uncharacterized protein n=1 Tax=Fictibacillus macauensis ZFHKF-1 TaxID=1196324 RepID=I8UIJ8_9BACL|nr:hypothetical protein A374_03719 [Fictibacillus macauensis ZFHKF-1]
MLARAATPVVFVPGEKISQGILVSTGLTAGNSPKSQDMVTLPLMCHSDVVFSETKRVERGKPHERETQIMVGEFSLRN